MKLSFALDSKPRRPQAAPSLAHQTVPFYCLHISWVCEPDILAANMVLWWDLD